MWQIRNWLNPHHLCIRIPDPTPVTPPHIFLLYQSPEYQYGVYSIRLSVTQRKGLQNISNSMFQIHVLIKEWQVMRGWWWVGWAVIIILSRIWPTASAHGPARTSPSSAGTQPSSAIRLGIAKSYSYGTTGILTLFQVRKSIDHPTYRYPFFMSVLFLLIFH